MDVPPCQSFTHTPRRIERNASASEKSRLAGLAIRLRGNTSFPEKLRPFVVKCGANCAAAAGRSAKEKGARRRLSLFRACCASQQILAKQLALRELERPARLGAAVLLALDHARVAGQETPLFGDPRAGRAQKGQALATGRAAGPPPAPTGRRRSRCRSHRTGRR